MLTAAQIRSARALLGWSQSELVTKTALSPTTIKRMESEGVGPERSSAGNVDTVRKALEAAGVEFIPENGGGAGVRWAKRKDAIQ